MNANRNKRKFYWVFLLLPVFTLACSLLTTSMPLAFQNTQEQVQVEAFSATDTPLPTAEATSTSASSAAVSMPAGQDEQALLIELYKKVGPAVVSINIYREITDGTMRYAGAGSGFLYDNQRHIVTNTHVAHGADQIDVIFPDGTIRPARLIADDFSSDLAVIQVSEVPPGVKPIPLGDMSKVVVGQTVVAIGNPFALGSSMSKGIVSAIGRTIAALNVFSIPEAIQTDAAINPGNSGGPLLNLKGEVIGINDQIETSGTSSTPSNSGVGFAIPVSIVKRVVPALIANGKYTWSWLGVSGYDLNPTTAKGNKLSIEKGAYIDEVVEDGPAGKAGLQGSRSSTVVDSREVATGGDVITAIDKQPINSFDDLQLYIALKTSPGQKITLTVLRAGKTITLTVTLEPRPASLENPETGSGNTQP